MTEIVLKKNEERVVPLLWTGLETELSYNIVLAEPGANVKLVGLLLGKGAHSLVLRVTVTHAAPQTTSNVVIKSALTDSAKVEVHGLVQIEPGAKGTQTWLAAHLLLLSEKAKGLAIPSLEILENDVKAGHATTVGRLSDLELFYLMSRGLPKKLARQLVVSGFMREITDQFPPELVKAAEEALRSEPVQN